MSDQSLPDDPEARLAHGRPYRSGDLDALVAHGRPYRSGGLDALVAHGRPYRSGDLDALVALARVCLDADGGLPLTAEPGFLAARWGASGATTRLMSGGGTLVAAAVLRDGPRLSTLVHPAVRPAGVEEVLLDWGLARAPDATVETESLTADRELLLTSRGLRQVFAEDALRITLADPVPAPAWPPGITLSTWSEATAGRFHAVYAAAFRERPGFPDLPAPEWIAEVSGEDSFRPEWSVLASDAGGAGRVDGADDSDRDGSDCGGSDRGGSEYVAAPVAAALIAVAPVAAAVPTSGTPGS